MVSSNLKFTIHEEYLTFETYASVATSPSADLDLSPVHELRKGDLSEYRNDCLYCIRGISQTLYVVLCSF